MGKVPARRRFSSLLGLAVALAVAAAACVPPEPPSGDLFAAWQNNDPAAATSRATPAAKAQLFSVAYDPADQWFFNFCDGTAGHANCRWTNKAEESLILAVSHVLQPNVVDQVTRTDIGAGPAAVLFHAWRDQRSDEVGSAATPAAAFSLFLRPYSYFDHWSLSDCSHSAGTLNCIWFGRPDYSLLLRISDGPSPQVIEVIAITATP